MNKSKKILLTWYIELGMDCFFKNSKTQNLQNKINNINNSNINNKQKIRLISQQMADNCDTIEQLQKTVKNFDKLDITRGATNTVFADGNPKSKIMFIGEAPGINEDRFGIPFCGKSGKLLDNILRAIKLNRKNCYITNTIFWRPPANRKPTPNEIEICKPFVKKHIALINPKIIVLVGGTAVESLLGIKAPMNQLRKQRFQYIDEYVTKTISTFIIFHPSYLLRQPSQKKTMWHDIQKIYQCYKML